MNNTTPPHPPFPPVPPFAPFPPRPYPPPPPPMPYHPSIHRDSDCYTRKEVDERDAATLAAAKTYADGKYEKPESGIPATDLSSGVQESLAKADTALQEHQSLSGYATEEWVGEQGFLTEHQSLSGYVQKSETSGLLKNDGSVDTNTYLTEHQSLSGYVQKSALFDNPDTNPMVKSALLPSYVDDVLEYASTSGFPSSGETGKIYVALDTNKTYRWGGSEYVQVGGGELPALATVATTGDYGDLINKPTIPSVPSAATATPLMDGTAAVGSGTKWAKEDHVHPTDTSRAAADSVVALSGNQTIYGNKTFSGQVRAADIVSDFSYGFSGSDEYITAPENTGAALTDADIQDTNSALGSVLAEKADSSGLATVATTGSYSDLSGLPTIPAAQVNADWNAASGVAQILNKPTIPSDKPTHIYNDGGFNALNDKGALYDGSLVESYWTGSNISNFAYDGYSDRGWGGIGKTYNWTNGSYWVCYKPETGFAYRERFSGGYWNVDNIGSAGVGLDPTAGDVLSDLPNYFSTNNGLTFHKKDVAISSSPYGHFALETAPTRAIAASTAYAVGDLLGAGGKAYRCKSAYTSASSNPTSPSSDTTHWEEIGTLSEKALAKSLAAEYNSAKSSAYAVGDYVTYQGALYKCSTATANPPGDWDSTKWTAVSAMAEMPAPGAPNHKVYAATATASQVSGATVFAATTFGGDFSRDNGCVVVFMAPSAASGSSPQLNVDGTGARPIVYKATSGFAGVPASEITTGKVCFCQFRTGNDITGKNLWVLLGWEKAPLASPAFTGAPTAPTANAGTNTTQVATTAFVQTAVAGKADASHTHASVVSPDGDTTVAATNDGEATITTPVQTLEDLRIYLGLSESATLADVQTAMSLGDSATLADALALATGGVTKTLATTNQIPTKVSDLTNDAGYITSHQQPRYALATPATTASTTSTTDDTLSATLADRAINTISVASGVTTLNLAFPAAVSSYARDFFVRIVAAGTDLATVGLTADGAAADIEIGADDLADWNKAGTHLVLFTEVAAGKWLASKRLEEASA